MGATQRMNEGIILLAFGVSSLGAWLYRLALPLAVLRITHSAQETALMYTLEFVPYIVLGPLAGRVADRVDRRGLVIGVQAAMALWSGIFGLMLTHSRLGIVELFVFGAILSCGQVFFQPGFYGLLAGMVSPKRLGLVNARIQIVQSLLTAGGPAFGAMMAVDWGVPNAVLLDGASFGLAAALLIGLRFHAAKTSGDELSTGDTTVDLPVRQYLKERPDLLYGILLFAGTNFGLMAIESNILFIVAHDLRLSRTLAGLSLGIGGVGALVGSLVSTYIRAPVGRVVVVAMAMAGVLTVIIAADSWVVLVVAWALVSGLVSIIVVAWLTYQEQTIPVTMIGRVTAIGTMASFIAIPAGAIVGGYLVGRHGGLVSLALVAGGIQVVSAGIGYRSPLWHADSSRPTLEAVPVGR